MTIALWRKHWMELRGRWFYMVVLAAAPGILLALTTASHPGANVHAFRVTFEIFAVFALGFFPARSAGTGITTFANLHPQKGTDPSMLFMLSLPARRRTLFLLRAASGILTMISAAFVGLTIDTLLFLRLGAPWHLFLSALWLFPILLPLYFLDSLLSIRLSEAAVMQVQVICFVLLFFIIRWTGTAFLSGMVAGVLPHLAILPVILAACIVSTVFAALTVWRLDRQNF